MSTAAQSPLQTITVEVAYALPLTQTLLTLRVVAGTTALDAVRQSGITQRHPEIIADQAVLGIFGKQVPAQTILKQMDRVEIYRPLIADAKTARRQRAAAKNGKHKQPG